MTLISYYDFNYGSDDDLTGCVTVDKCYYDSMIKVMIFMMMVYLDYSDDDAIVKKILMTILMITLIDEKL